MKKKLYRSNDHRILFGVCGGFADYFGIDPKYIRIGYLIFGLICSVFARLSILPVGIYVILALAMPLNPNQSATSFSSFFGDQTSNRPARPNNQGRKVIRDVKEKDIKK